MLPDLKKNADGSLTIYMQKDSPGADKESNWLPAPDGPIYVAMRLYWPKEDALKGSCSHAGRGHDRRCEKMESRQGLSTLDAGTRLGEREIRSGRTLAREPVQGQGYDTLAAAHSQAFEKMSANITAAIRAEADQKS
jgi:hypothetical protein